MGEDKGSPKPVEIFIYTAYIPYIQKQKTKMVQAMIDIPESANHILNIVKARYKLKTKSEAIAKVIEVYGEDFLEPELKPEYLVKLEGIEKEKGIPFKSMTELRRIIEG